MAKYYNRQFLRKHFATNIYVSNDGKHAERDIQIKATGKDTVLIYDVFKEDTGRAFIVDKYKGTCYMDELVLTCFRGQPPRNGKKYYPFHKDGDWANSNIANLEWREETAATIAEYRKLEKMAWYKKRKIVAYKNGTVKQNGSSLHFVDYIYDPDLDWHFHKIEPWIRYEVKNRFGRTERHDKDVAEIFEDFGFIHGDKSQFANPVVLHKNNDYKDFTSDNLEWVDASDSRYKEFCRVCHDAKMKKDHDSNCWVSELSWNTLYGPDEPYQNWSDRKR